MGFFNLFKKSKENGKDLNSIKTLSDEKEGLSAQEKKQETDLLKSDDEKVNIEQERTFKDDQENKVKAMAISDGEDFLAKANDKFAISEQLKEVSQTSNDKVSEESAEPNSQAEKSKKTNFFARLFAGLGKTRKNILGGVDSVLGMFSSIDEELFEELEEALIMADIGVSTTMSITEKLRKRVKREHITDPLEIKKLLMEEISLILQDSEEKAELETPAVILVIGVNGVGKTTTIGKLSLKYKKEGKTVLLAAADTFRAAAIDQLEVWSKRAGCEIIKRKENSDPAAVVFDGVSAAKSRKTDLLICDTAGRLHNKKNLMEELKKIYRVIEREYPSAHKEVYLVLDATTGQNAIAQAKIFKEAADITGIILTKLDGTAKGGIVIAIKSELNIPIKYIGVGEQIDDLQKFNAESFSKALLGIEK